MIVEKKTIYSIIISNFFSGIADVLFAPILLNYLASNNVSGWIIALVTVLEYLPRIFSPIISKIISNRNLKRVLQTSVFIRFACYLLISLLIFFYIEKGLFIGCIFIIIILNFISDVLGSFYFLNQTIINKTNISNDNITKVSSSLFLTSNLGIFIAYSIAPVLQKFLMMEHICLINALLFLVPLMQLKFIKNSKNNVESTNKKNVTLNSWNIDKVILYPIIFTFLLNLFIGNPNFIITKYASQFNLSIVKSISLFSSLYLIGTVISSSYFSISKRKIPFIWGLTFSYINLGILYFSFLFSQSAISVVIYLSIGILMGILQPALNNIFYLNSDENNISYYFSICSLCNSTGSIIAPFLIQFIMSVLNYTNSIYLIALYYLILTFIALYSKKYLT